jgi:hypothetical protein
VDNAWVVDVTEIGFSRKVLRVRTGKITPTRPTMLTATRPGARRGVVDFESSGARGAKVTGYTGECEAVRGGHGVGVASNDTESIIGFSGLRPGVAYDCRVRATSKVGPSRWSSTVTVPAKPS